MLLGVNIDHVATLRNARGTNYPSPLEAALTAETHGADLITLHLREDRRHMKDDDVAAIRRAVKTRINLELTMTEEMLAHALSVRPDDVCIVPEKREEVTTEGGLDVLAQREKVARFTGELHAAGIRVSLFIGADQEQIQAAFDAGARVIELHTGAYADAHPPRRRVCRVAGDDGQCRPRADHPQCRPHRPHPGNRRTQYRPFPEQPGGIYRPARSHRPNEGSHFPRPQPNRALKAFRQPENKKDKEKP